MLGFGPSDYTGVDRTYKHLSLMSLRLAESHIAALH